MRRVKDQMTKRLSPRTWSPEEKKIRRYVWRGGEVQPHESLERFVAELDEVSSVLPVQQAFDSHVLV